MNPLIEAFLQAAAPFVLQAAGTAIQEGLQHASNGNHPKTLQAIQEGASVLQALLNFINHPAVQAAAQKQGA